MLVPLGVMVPGVWDEGKQEGWGKAKESRSPYALWSLSFLCSLSSPFISGFAQTQWDMLILDCLYSICASSSPFCLSASLLALIVHCRLSEVTVKLSGWWFGDGVTAWLFAYVFVWISVSFDDLSSQSKVCLVRILFAVLFVDMDFSIFSHILLFFPYLTCLVAELVLCRFLLCCTDLRVQCKATYSHRCFLPWPQRRNMPRIEMTCRLKIATKLTHPSLKAAPLWPDDHLPNHWSLHPSMKCRLLPLYIPPRGMSQLPCKLERGGLSLFSARQRQQANRSRTASNHWLVWLSSQGGRLLRHKVGVPQGFVAGPLIAFFFFLQSQFSIIVGM